jgi:teichuronic acid exporter
VISRRRITGFFSGAAWSALNALVSVALPLGIFVFFARSLAPAELGMVAFATAAAELIKGLGPQGVYEALLSRGGADRSHHATAAAMLIAAGLLLFLVFSLLIEVASLVIDGIAAHRLVLSAIGLKIVFDLAALQPLAALAQQQAFGRLAMRSVLANVVAGCAGVSAALLVDPILGLVIYYVCQSMTSYLVAVIGTGASSLPRFDRRSFMALAHEAGWATAVRFCATANSYLDQVLIGTLLDLRSVAFLNIAKRVESSMMTIGSSFVSILIQPLFATRQDADRAGLMAQSLALLGTVCGMPAAVLIACHDVLVDVVFGRQWGAAAQVVAILAVSGYVRVLTSVHGALLSVSHRNRDVLALSTASAALGALIVVAVYPLGIVALAALLTGKSFIFFILSGGLIRRQAPVPLRAYATDLALPFAMMLAGSFAGRMVAASSPVDGAWSLALASAAGAAVGCTVAAGMYWSGRMWMARPHPRLTESVREGAGGEAIRPAEP